MRSLAIALLLALDSLWCKDPEPEELLPKDQEATYQAHARDLRILTKKMEADLQLSIPDERLRLHLPKRGFPYLASLVYNDALSTYACSAAFLPDRTLKSFSGEELIAEGLVAQTMVVRLAANNYACFRVLKELAPSPEAMEFEARAKDLSTKLFPDAPNPNEVEVLEGLESIRALFDQMKDLPKLTPEQLADERAETAVLAFRERGDGSRVLLPQSGKKWVERELKWHGDWDHQGYLVAFSNLFGPNDYEQFKIVINLRGGIFEWNQPYDGSHFGPDSYESKLPEDELRGLKDFLAKLPPSDAPGEESHFVVSFLQGGRWITRTFNSPPAGSPFENLLHRMIRQSQINWLAVPSSGNGLLQP